MSALLARRASDDPFSEVHVYEPHRAGLPPLGKYLGETWRRRRFAFELSRTQLRANHIDSALGAVWLVLNPLLLAFVYFVLILALGGKGTPGSSRYDNLLHIVVGIFTWYLAQNTMMVGATAVTSSSGLILNQSFPRVLLVIGSTVNAVTQYLPTIPIYLVLFAIGKGFGLTNSSQLDLSVLWLPLLLVLLVVTAFGLAMLFSTMTVFYRDTSKFLAYLVRIWLYLSPVLFSAETLVTRFKSLGKPLLYLNPLGPALGSITDVWTRGEPPSPSMLGAAFIWAVLLLLIGGYFFVSREREFAVRL